MEPLYCGHLGDLVKCPVYSGNPLLWTPWGPGEVSCMERGVLISGLYSLPRASDTQIESILVEKRMYHYYGDQPRLQLVYGVTVCRVQERGVCLC